MLIKRKELLSVLNQVKAGTGNEISEGMAYFFFTGKSVVTYNNIISISHPFKTDFNTFVKADSFLKLINRISVDDINMSVEKGKLRTKAKAVNSNLATIFDEDVEVRVKQVAKSLKKVKWKPIRKGFIQGLTLCSFIASTNESQQTLTCVNVKGKTLGSSDNIRLSSYTMKKSMDEMLIKASEVKNLVGIDPVKYGISGSWVHFKNVDDCVFSIRLVKGEFPDFSEFLDVKGAEVDLPSKITEGLDLTSIVMDSGNPHLKISMKEGVCTIVAKSDEGIIKHKSKIDYKGKELTFIINPDFLKEMMKHSTNIIIGETMAKITSGAFTMITALLQDE